MSEQFPPNSAKSKEPSSDAEPKVKQVVSAPVTERKKALGTRFKETFVNQDSRSVAGYVLWDILIPAAKETIADMVSQGIEKMLFGEARSRSRRTSSYGNSSTGFVNYGGFSQQKSSSPSLSRRARATHDFGEIVIPIRAEAEEVLDQIFLLIDQYGQATVADLYDMVGISASYTDRKWGWTDAKGAGVTRLRDGYRLDLPRPIEL